VRRQGQFDSDPAKSVGAGSVQVKVNTAGPDVPLSASCTDETTRARWLNGDQEPEPRYIDEAVGRKGTYDDEQAA
jgi:hypothetical protein